MCFNGYCNGFGIDQGAVLTAIKTATVIMNGSEFKGAITTPAIATIRITEGIENIFICVSTSDQVWGILAANNSIERLFGTPCIWCIFYGK